MTDQYPKSLEELTEENAMLRAEVDRLQRSVGSLQATVVARDVDIMALRRPKAKPRTLDQAAPDAFSRPAYSRR